MQLRSPKALYGIACVVGIVCLVRTALAGWVFSLRQFPYDGRVDWIVARAFLSGINPYSPEALRAVGMPSLGHPPTTGLWMLPFATFELADMSAIYGHFVLLALFGMLLAVCRELRWPWPTLTATFLFLAISSLGWFHYSLRVAQIGALIAFAFMAAWLLLRRGHDVAAGIVLGLACTIKLHPGLLVVFLLLSRRYRGVAAAAAAYLLMVAIVTWRFGFVAWQQYSQAEGPVMHLWAANKHNASLYGLVLRTITPICQGVGVPTTTSTLIVVAIAIALGAGALALIRKAPRDTASLDLSFALFVVLAVFLNPFVFEHYFLQLMLPFLIAMNELHAARTRGLSRRWLGVAAVVMLAIGIMYVVDPFAKDALHDGRHHVQLHVYEVANWLHIVLLGGLLAALLTRASRRSAQHADRGPDLAP